MYVLQQKVGLSAAFNGHMRTYWMTICIHSYREKSSLSDSERIEIKNATQKKLLSVKVTKPRFRVHFLKMRAYFCSPLEPPKKTELFPKFNTIYIWEPYIYCVLE